MRAGKDGDESIRQLFDGRVLDGLLLDLDVLGDGVKELHRAELNADGAERRTRLIKSCTSCWLLVFHVADTP